MAAWNFMGCYNWSNWHETWRLAQEYKLQPLWPIRSINGWMHDKNWRIFTKPNFACVSTKTGGLTDIRIGRRFFIKLVLFLMTFTKQEAIVLSQPTYAYISVAGKSNFRRVWLWNKNFASSSDEQKYYIMTCFRFVIDQRWRQKVLVAHEAQPSEKLMLLPHFDIFCDLEV